MKYLKKLVALCLLISVLLPSNIATATTPKLNRTTLNISTVDRVTLKVLNTNKKVTWSSSNKSVVKVNQKGEVTPQWFGKATITAKIGNKILKCKVSVLYEDFWFSTKDDRYSCSVMPITKTKARVKVFITYKGKDYSSGNMKAKYENGYYIFQNQGKYNISGSFKVVKQKYGNYAILLIKKSNLKAFINKDGFYFDDKIEST